MFWLGKKIEKNNLKNLKMGQGTKKIKIKIIKLKQNRHGTKIQKSRIKGLRGKISKNNI